MAIQTYKQPAVYIMTNKRNGTLYTGVTSNLPSRNYQHKAGYYDGFSRNTTVLLLVWFEIHEMMEPAILREKQIKSWSRKKKLALIETQNPTWLDLSGTLF